MDGTCLRRTPARFPSGSAETGTAKAAATARDSHFGTASRKLQVLIQIRHRLGISADIGIVDIGDVRGDRRRGIKLRNEREGVSASRSRSDLPAADWS